MSTYVSGPMFERSKSTYWESVHGKDGGHYNNFSGPRNEDGMAALRSIFPDGANEYNVCLFSTSGVHGLYNTIEEAEEHLLRPVEDETCGQVTYLIVQPRICTVRHGNCEPQTAEDIAFLKALRASSHAELAKIGMPKPKRIQP